MVCDVINLPSTLQVNLSIMATFWTGESGRCGKVAVCEGSTPR